jgi:hypothetical protein
MQFEKWHLKTLWILFAILLCQKEELVDADKNDEAMAKSMLADATQIDRLQSELQDLVRKIESQTSKLAPGKHRIN